MGGLRAVAVLQWQQYMDAPVCSCCTLLSSVYWVQAALSQGVRVLLVCTPSAARLAPRAEFLPLNIQSGTLPIK